MKDILICNTIQMGSLFVVVLQPILSLANLNKHGISAKLNVCCDTNEPNYMHVTISKLNVSCLK